MERSFKVDLQPHVEKLPWMAETISSKRMWNTQQYDQQRALMPMKAPSDRAGGFNVCKKKAIAAAENSMHETLREKILEGLQSSSRTLRTGRVDGGVGDKASRDVDQDETNAQAATAVETVLEEIDRYKGQNVKLGAKALKAFIEGLARIVANVPKDGGASCNSLFRKHEVPYGDKVPPDAAAMRMDAFYEQLAFSLERMECDFIELAAWVEREIDRTIHPFEDGCSRVSKLTSAFVLLFGGAEIPVYPSREVYYSALEGRLFCPSEDRRVAVDEFWHSEPRLRTQLEKVTPDAQFGVCFRTWVGKGTGKIG